MLGGRRPRSREERRKRRGPLFSVKRFMFDESALTSVQYGWCTGGRRRANLAANIATFHAMVGVVQVYSIYVPGRCQGFVPCAHDLSGIYARR